MEITILKIFIKYKENNNGGITFFRKAILWNRDISRFKIHRKIASDGGSFQ